MYEWQVVALAGATGGFLTAVFRDVDPLAEAPDTGSWSRPSQRNRHVAGCQPGSTPTHIAVTRADGRDRHRDPAAAAARRSAGQRLRRRALRLQPRARPGGSGPRRPADLRAEDRRAPS